MILAPPEFHTAKLMHLAFFHIPGIHSALKVVYVCFWPTLVLCNLFKNMVFTLQQNKRNKYVF